MTASHSSSVMFDEHPVAQDAGVVDEHVEAAERVDRLLDDPLGAVPKSQTSSALATASPPAAAISSTTSWAGPRGSRRCRRRAAEVVDHHLGAVRGEHRARARGRCRGPRRSRCRPVLRPASPSRSPLLSFMRSMLGRSFARSIVRFWNRRIPERYAASSTWLQRTCDRLHAPHRPALRTQHVADISALARYPDFAAFDPSGLDELLGEAGRFVDEVMAPLIAWATPWARSQRRRLGVDPPGFARRISRFVDSGWSAAAFDPEYRRRRTAVDGEPRGAGDDHRGQHGFLLVPLAHPGAVHPGCVPRVARGSAQTYLPSMITGEWTGTMNLTEPHAGSDVGALTTKAMPPGRRHVPDLRPEDLHHLRRARPDREHRPSGPGPHPRCAAGHPGNLVLHRAQVPRRTTDGAPGRATISRCVSMEHKLGIHASPDLRVSSSGSATGAVGYLIGEEQRACGPCSR